MPMYDEFLGSLLPGNYALTKSMELTRVRDSGTLWYTKKFLTLYYFVFLSNDIMTTEYRQKVIDIFDSFIAGMDEELQPQAKAFFYPEDDAVNFKSENFNLFANFASRNVFDTRLERDRYYQSAKKCYFTLLMGSGGQTGIKSKLKQAIRRPGFVYSHDNIDAIILDAAIDSCMTDANAERCIIDNSTKYILSHETMDRACSMAAHHPVDEADIRELDRAFPHESPSYRGIENDFVAFIRNERQVLYYYGFFHSRSTGYSDFEFSSLTPIGELALKANYIEFLAIWEHQKIKMISQPVTAEIKQITAVDNSPERFGISYTPYTDILGHLMRRGSLSLDEYKYIVSRKKHSFDAQAWAQEEAEIFGNLGAIKAQVNAFGRDGDRKDDDGRKELLKYLLGIRGDIPKDDCRNPLNIVDFRRSAVHVADCNALAMLYGTYRKLDDYKIRKFGQVFADCEQELRRRYIAALHGGDTQIDDRVKIYWDLYNIHPDNFIMLSIAVTISAVSLGITAVVTMSADDISSISTFMHGKFAGLLGTLGLSSLAAVKREVQRVVACLRDEDYEAFINAGAAREEQTLARYRTENAADLRERIEQISASATVSPAENRARNAQLVGLLKSYYMSRFADNNMLKCECCGAETFTTYLGEPYVEFHHFIPFGSTYGPDHFLNLFALCPDCHRRIHFLPAQDKRAKYASLSVNNYLHLGFTERLRTLKAQNLLRSYHLEYLMADGAITQAEYNRIIA